MKKAISAVLTLLLISGCVAPPRQLSKSDAVVEVAKSSSECPVCTCPKAPECAVVQKDFKSWLVVYGYYGYCWGVVLSLWIFGCIWSKDLSYRNYVRYFKKYYEAVKKWREVCRKQYAEIQRLNMIIAQMQED
ncbi:MAG: hypothetical protein LE169_05695 [Endomicrobium sp.]|nr:hypothetical protein [Endomicrobium sp.]